MVSICIPIFNTCINQLIEDLTLQLKQNAIDYEIILIDDASNPEFRLKNVHLKSIENIQYIELHKNIGRSAIRNLFLNYARFNYLLFLDCDTQINNKHFITNYIGEMKNHLPVVCGGRMYAEKPPKKSYKLRWKYGVARECNKAAKRNESPWHSFMTNNFIIEKKILEKIQFNERIKGYGHEDSVFGFELMKQKVPVKHIDNETIHNFNENADEFLCKTRQGLENLYFIDKKLIPSGEFKQVNTLLRTYAKLNQLHLEIPLALISYLKLKPLAILFNSGIVNLWLFDFYKLLYFCRIVIFGKHNN